MDGDLLGEVRAKLAVDTDAGTIHAALRAALVDGERDQNAIDVGALLDLVRVKTRASVIATLSQTLKALGVEHEIRTTRGAWNVSVQGAPPVAIGGASRVPVGLVRRELEKMGFDGVAGAALN